MIPAKSNIADLLTSCGFHLAPRESSPCAVVSVRRTNDGYSVIESWSLDPHVTDELHEQLRNVAKSLVDGISTSGETMVVFALDCDGCPAVLQVARGALSR